jgi:hypothetical protein
MAAFSRIAENGAALNSAESVHSRHPKPQIWSVLAVVTGATEIAFLKG